MSVIEATLDDPRPILSQEEFKARGEAVAAMKAGGLDYDERMAALEEVTYPKPLEELSQAYEVFASSQPWVRDFELSPKSVVRDVFERAPSLSELISLYQLARSDGLVLRYLSDAYGRSGRPFPPRRRPKTSMTSSRGSAKSCARSTRAWWTSGRRWSTRPRIRRCPSCLPLRPRC